MLLNKIPQTEVVELGNSVEVNKDKTGMTYYIMPLDVSKLPANENYEKATEFNYVIDWINNDTLLSLYRTIDFKAENNRYIKRIIFKKFKYTRKEIKELKSFSVDIPLEVVNENINYHISSPFLMNNTTYYEKKYILKVSPDKKNLLISIDSLIPEEKETGFSVYNKGYGYIYNLSTNKANKIADDARYITWSSDSKSLYGSKYCVAEDENNDYNMNEKYIEFIGKVYKHTKYDLESNKVTNIVEDLTIKQNNTISKPVYNDYFNVKVEATKDGCKPFYRWVGQHFFSSSDKYELNNFIQNSEILGENNGKYVLASNQVCATLKNNEISFVGRKNLARQYNPLLKQLINDNTMLSSGSIGMNSTLSSVNCETDEVEHLYYGNVSCVAYSNYKNRLAFYDNNKKEIFVATYKDGKLTNIETVYNDIYAVGELKFSAYGDKLFVLRSPFAGSLIIDVFTGKVTELKGRFCTKK
ncbi:hypothetical protein IMX26_00025 [Clostridium sp. 'deep sea']|uniref:hypothetical protein n=1 Tax=Clostridium sp. 'deep sea' TaxID=2779445 RepID=UPI0018966F6D|nr:hypothetical protein [Clostridium sp. 'deep sea']QOR35263.1 hypothetical protein IMX26_00025 [Clostridium sp. 'deep sea']